MTKKFRYLRLSSLYHLMDGLSFDVAACADVLETALTQLNVVTGLPDRIVQWNKRGGRAVGPLKLAGRGGIAIEMTETFSPSHGKMHMTTVIEKKDDPERAPVVFLSMRSTALDIPMRVEIPLRTVLRGSPALAGTYAVGTFVLERQLRGLAGGVLAVDRRLGLLDRCRQESKTLSLGQDPEDFGGFLVDNLDGADVLGPQRNVD